MAKVKEAPKDRATGSASVGGAPKAEPEPTATPPTQQQAIDQAYNVLATLHRQGPFNSDLRDLIKSALAGLKLYTTMTGPY